MQIKCNTEDRNVGSIQNSHDLFVRSTVEIVQERGILLEFFNRKVFNVHEKPGKARNLLNNKNYV